MQEPVPQGIIQPADQTPQLHEGVRGELNQAGISATPQSLNPEDNHPLQVIHDMVGEVGHAADREWKERVEGVGEERARERTAKGKIAGRMAAAFRFLKNRARG